MMPFLCFKQSITDFVRGSRKTKCDQRLNSVDEFASSIMSALDYEVPVTPGVDEHSFVDDLHSAYHVPGTLNACRAIKRGLNSPPLSVSVHLPHESINIPTAKCPTIKANLSVNPLHSTKDFTLVPRTPLLPSTPVFEESFDHPFDKLPSPCTPSWTCSTPALSSPSPNVSTTYFSEPRALKIEDFQLLRFLSKGICGQVHLTKDTVSNRRLALKIVKKDDDIFQMSVLKEMLVQEKDIMVSLQGCEWFVQLQASWYDSKNIYFAMTYYPTDLESEIIRCAKLSANRARFYMAEVIIALEELHSRGIVHRDIKAANILISSDGHLVLADFGLSKDFGRKPNLAERSYQPYWPFKMDDDVLTTACRSPEELTFVTDDICGSEVEMAPEILLEEYYSFGVDFWAAGITLYLMVTGKHPWSDDKEKSIQCQILEDDVEFSSEDQVGEECQDFILQMLRKEPTERLRIGLDMTSHPYFAGVDWVAMKNRTISTPWVPHFVSGHFYYEEWGLPELFEPGYEVKKDEDKLLSNFLFTSPDFRKYTEASLDNLFGDNSKDPVDCDKASGLVLGDITRCEFLSTGQVYSPNFSMLDSHASMLPSSHSASSLQRLIDEGSPVHSPVEVSQVARIKPKVENANPVPGPAGVRPELVFGYSEREDLVTRGTRQFMFAGASRAEPVLFTRPILFRPVLEPLMECSESHPEFGSNVSSQNRTVISGQLQDFAQAMELVNKVVSWLKSLLPSPVKKAHSAFPNAAISGRRTIRKALRWNLRTLLISKVGSS